MKMNGSKEKRVMVVNAICAGVCAAITVFDFIQGNTWLGIGSTVLTAWCVASAVAAYMKTKKCKAVSAAGNDLYVDED